MGWTNDQPNDLTIPAGASGSQARIVIGPDIPAEITAYYATASIGFNLPEIVVGATLYYDGQGNYFYEVEVYDSSAHRVTSIAYGSSFGGTVKEAYRITMYPLDGHQNVFYGRTKVTMHTGTADDLTFILLGAAQADDQNADRWTVRADGALGWGPGGINQAQDTTLYRAAPGVLAADTMKWNNAGAAETWHAMTLQNGWTNFGGGFVTAQYRRVLSPANSVQITGVIAPGTKVDATTIATLPAGYRPSSGIRFPVAQDGAAATNQRMDIGTTGDLKIYGVNLAGLAAVEFNEIIPLDV